MGVGIQLHLYLLQPCFVAKCPSWAVTHAHVARPHRTSGAHSDNLIVTTENPSLAAVHHYIFQDLDKTSKHVETLMWGADQPNVPSCKHEPRPSLRRSLSKILFEPRLVYRESHPTNPSFSEFLPRVIYDGVGTPWKSVKICRVPAPRVPSVPHLQHLSVAYYSSINRLPHVHRRLILTEV